jgi:hypothetical protein
VWIGLPEARSRVARKGGGDATRHVRIRPERGHLVRIRFRSTGAAVCGKLPCKPDCRRSFQPRLARTPPKAAWATDHSLSARKRTPIPIPLRAARNAPRSPRLTLATAHSSDAATRPGSSRCARRGWGCGGQDWLVSRASRSALRASLARHALAVHASAAWPNYPQKFPRISCLGRIHMPRHPT